MRMRDLVWVGACALTAGGAHALTLGPAKGAAWIGRSLSITVPIQWDADSQGATGIPCVQADVVYGESRMVIARVETQTDPASPLQSWVTISTNTTVDEPVVTVHMKVGCDQLLVRQYVLLANFPEEVQLPSLRISAEPVVAPAQQRPMAEVPPSRPAVVRTAPPPAPRRVAAPAHAPTAAAPTVNPPPQRAAVAAAPPPPPIAITQAPAPAPPPAPAAAAAPAAPPAAKSEPEAKTGGNGTPRLRLEAADELMLRIDALEASRLAQTEALAEAADREKRLKSDIRVLLDQASRNEARLLAIQQRLEAAESSQVPSWVLYGLVGLTLLSMGLAGTLWFTRQGQRPGWLPAWAQSSSGSGPA